MVKPMDRAMDVATKNELIALVRKVAKHYGETEENFKEYIVEIIIKDRQSTLRCFKYLANQCVYMPKIQTETVSG
jgi:hypothetical protein